MDTNDMATLAQRLSVLEAEAAVRRVMARYLQLCDTPTTSDTLPGLAELFTDDAIWAGRGTRYQAEFGEQRGMPAILAMFKGFLDPEPHYLLNAHYLTSESIIADHGSATGEWMLLQAATDSAGASELRSARLRVSFKRTSGHWKIARFETTGLFRRGINSFDA